MFSVPSVVSLDPGRRPEGTRVPPADSIARVPPAALTSGPSRLFLLDGMALAYRAHFAFLKNPLTTSKG